MSQETFWPAPGYAFPTLPPSCGTPTQRRQLRFCASHKPWCSGWSREDLDLDPSCKGFLSVRLAGTQMWHQISSAGTEELSDSWLWLQGRAAPLPSWSFLEGLRAPGQGVQAGQNPSKTQTQESPDSVWGHVGGQMRLESGVGGDKADGGGRRQQHIWKGEVLSREPGQGL